MSDHFCGALPYPTVKIIQIHHSIFDAPVALYPNLLQAQSKRPLHEKSTNSLREFFRLFAPVVLLFAALVTLYPNLLADKSELRFRNIWQSFSRITAYFFQRFTFFRQLALSPNVLQAQGKRALQKMATNSL